MSTERSLSLFPPGTSVMVTEEGVYLDIKTPDYSLPRYKVSKVGKNVFVDIMDVRPIPVARSLRPRHNKKVPLDPHWKGWKNVPKREGADERLYRLLPQFWAALTTPLTAASINRLCRVYRRMRHLMWPFRKKEYLSEREFRKTLERHLGWVPYLD